jgi:NADPH:quinone reductase
LDAPRTTASLYARPSMRAVRFHKLGGPDVLQLEDLPDPEAAPGEAVLAVRAAGVNWADTHFRNGTYFIKAQFPQIAGMEAAGEIVALGEGTTGLSIGDRVMALGSNAYAEKMIVKPQYCYPMHPQLDFVRAAALPVQGITAHHILSLCGRLAKGESVLVHAAAGGVGTLAVQLAKSMGAARVIGTASKEKLGLVRELGADVAIDARSDDWAEQVKNATDRKGVDVILEMIGGTEHYRKNLAVLAHLGRMVVFGAASNDMKGTLEAVPLMGKNQSVIGYYMTSLLRRRDLCAPALDDLQTRVVNGDVRVIVGREARLDEAANVHREMESRATTGKVVLIP